MGALDAAEMFWLAGHMHGFRPAPGQIPGDAGLPGPRVSGSGSEPRSGDSDGDPRSSHDDRKIWYPKSGNGLSEAPLNGFGTLPLRLSDTRELRSPLDLQRGLRPLLKTMNIGPDLVLDEETTVNDSADARAVVPALIKSPGRWLDLVLVIDASPSMIIWDRLIAEFRRMLARLGAFRAIRTWYLRPEGKFVAISSGSSSGSPRAVKELIDPSGRQAILVVTDCVGEMWRTGDALKVLEAWARSGPLAIVQPLSERLWSRSAVACQRVELAAPYPGAPNHCLIIDPGHRPSVGQPSIGRPRAGTAIPILEMAPRWLAAWARLVCGTGSVHGMAAFTATPPIGNRDDGGSLPEHDPVRVVERFMAHASPEAVRLAGLIAAVPLNLPLMRHIQHAMLPDPRPQQLAEVFLGGLLHSIRATGPANENRNDVFEFVDGVREILLGTIRKTEAVRVMNLVSSERTKSYGKGEDVYVAYVEVPSGTPGVRHMTTADKFYGTIEAKVLRRMGLAETRTADAPAKVLRPAGAAKRIQVHRDTTEAGPTSQAPLELDRVVHHAQLERDSGATIGRLGHGITMLGTPGSGKTTLLAALGPALAQREEGVQWRLVPTDDGSAQTLITMITDITAKQTFPVATVGTDVSHNWQFWGEDLRSRWLWFRKPKNIRVDMHVADPSGEVFMQQPEDVERLIDTLVHSGGIVFMFDPIREFKHGDAFEYVLNVVTRLARRIIGHDPSQAGRLPHYVSVCVSKFDDKAIFEAAGELKTVTYSPADPYRFPRVADADAREFFAALCKVSKSGTARMAMDTIEQFFQPERIRYFVTSAIGFYVDRHTGIFSPDDYVNTMPGSTTRIRGPIHPINVAEPFIWLGGRLAAESPEP